jgi:helix-turn-helix protein
VYTRAFDQQFEKLLPQSYGTLPQYFLAVLDSENLRSLSLVLDKGLTFFSLRGLDMARECITSLTIHLTLAERRTLPAWQRATTISTGRARRGWILILLADGVPLTHIAAPVGISRHFVYKWGQRLLAQGVDALADKPGGGAHGVPSQAALAG